MENSIQSKEAETKYGDIVELISPSRKIFILKLSKGRKLHTHRGIVNHDDLVGLNWGTEIQSHTGRSFFLLQPTLADILQELPRSTQIMYPKDVGFILVQMGIGPGSIVIEAGSGSGGLTTALAWSVGDQGKIYSYEIRPDVKNLAEKNLKRFGLDRRVKFSVSDIDNGFNEKNVDSIFLDVPNPYDYLGQVRSAIKPGGYFGCILPTVNQVIRMISALHNHNFKILDICELLLRYYKPVQDRFRPTDRMVAHTGYLVFGRSILPTLTQDK